MALTLVFCVGVSVAQVPTQCLEIERVLVDACNSACSGATEGENEMFRFVVGPNPIILTDLEADWATPNPFLGWVQNASTADVTAQLNATITNCGWLQEPANGTLPAGSRVLGITSTNLCVPGNSFAGLSDTLYVIYQNAGNTLGHFKNTSNGNTVTNGPNGGADIRQFRLTDVAQQCSDMVEYNTNLLVNQYGTYGGSSVENDGASLVQNWSVQSAVNYVNDGCQAPFTPLTATITSDPDPVPCGGSTPLSGATTGNVAFVLWNGGSGSFSDAGSTNTTYTLGPDETEGTTLSFCAVSACGDTICDELELTVSGGLDLIITPDGPTTFCSGTSLQLTASGGVGYEWSTGATSAAITVVETGLVSVSSTNACGTTTAEIEINVIDPPTAGISGPALLCSGVVASIAATGGGSYLWDNGTTDSTLEVNGPGTYEVTVTNDCGSDQAVVDIGTAEALNPDFTVDLVEGCSPHCATFTATGALDAELTWDFGAAGSGQGAVATACFEAGVFDVTLRASPLEGDPRCAAEITRPALIRSWPAPSATYTVEPAVITMDAPQAHFISTSAYADSLQWSIATPDGFLSNASSFPFTFPFAGCFPLTLEAITVHGCTSVLNDEFCVEETFALWVPNSFSPNNDGINDVFHLITSVKEPERYELEIYDRWGQVLFRSTSLTAGWAGEDAPSGVYAWKLDMRDGRGQQHDRMGHVVLVR